MGWRAAGGDAASPGAADSYAVGEVRAIRTFRVDRDGVLYPLYTDRPWVAGSNTAHCKRRSHRAPDPGCRCGFYAYGDPVWTVAQPPSRSVLAVVALWGGLEVATRGVRAEHGRIQALWLHRRVPDEVVRAVQRRYPHVRLYRDRRDLLAEHPLTVLSGYQPPRLTGRRRQVVSAAAAALAVAGRLAQAMLLAEEAKIQHMFPGVVPVLLLYGYGWYRACSRLARACTLLLEAGLDHEGAALRRSLMEHMTALVWLARSGDVAVHALDRKHKQELKKFVGSLTGPGWPEVPGAVQEVLALALAPSTRRCSGT